MTGDYCAQCGQSGNDFNVPITRFVREFAGEALDIDSRLRVTLWPLFFKPGLVPHDYVAGHRARFVPPIRLYVFASFAMFLVLSLGPSTFMFEDRSEQAVAVEAPVDAPPNPGGADPGAAESSLNPTDADPTARESTSNAVDAGPNAVDQADDPSAWTVRLTDGLQRAANDREAFADAFVNRMAQAMFLLLPAFALLLKLAHRRRLYIHHLVFSVYFHSFVFIVVAIVAAPAAVGLEAVSDIAGIALFGVPVHLFLGMRRFYGETRLRTLLKFVGVWVAYTALGIATILGLIVVSLLTF
jgi:hypothetical protein